MLYPNDNEIREVKDLCGIWSFRVDARGEGRANRWYAEALKDTVPMPVPASYNDLTQDAAVRDHVGEVWYERTFHAAAANGRRTVLHFGSATSSATAWVNGEEVVRHEGGYLPFEADVTRLLRPRQENRLTVAVDNTLSWATLPPGEVKRSGPVRQEYFHDFFNYSGLDRPVKLYTTPTTYISDVTIGTDVQGTSGLVSYSVEITGGKPSVRVSLLAGDGALAARSEGQQGMLRVPSAHLWMPGKPYLYTMLIETFGPDSLPEDCYRLRVGIRTVEVTTSAFLINGVPFHFRGFGKHEDCELRGKGQDNVVIVKDFNLLKWIGANSFRTSHYPYSDEIMDMADRQGIVVIDEAPAVGMHFFNESESVFTENRAGAATLARHLQVMQELVARDKNHACVVMWSVANEAATYEKNSGPYFRAVVERLRALDRTRPATIVHANSSDALRSVVGDLFDVVCVNQYYGWYLETGHLELIEESLLRDLRKIRERYGKPIIVTEFGAEAIAGLHQEPPVMFSEEYQCEFLQRYFRAFDQLDFVIGEHVWCFADFATKQELSRVSGNRKGVFTRQRNPKAAAHLLRNRWSAAAAER
jgi:beta-glucuronidase